MEYNDTISIKLVSSASLSKTVTIVRKYLPLSISDIQNRIGSDTFLFSCDCTDEKGLSLLIKIYSQLAKAGTALEVYEGDELSSIDLIKNLKNSVVETRTAFGDLDDDEV